VEQNATSGGFNLYGIWAHPSPPCTLYYRPGFISREELYLRTRTHLQCRHTLTTREHLEQPRAFVYIHCSPREKHISNASVHIHASAKVVGSKALGCSLGGCAVACGLLSAPSVRSSSHHPRALSMRPPQRIARCSRPGARPPSRPVAQCALSSTSRSPAKKARSAAHCSRTAAQSLRSNPKRSVLSPIAPAAPVFSPNRSGRSVLGVDKVVAR